jgi:hypothetical protein
MNGVPFSGTVVSIERIAQRRPTLGQVAFVDEGGDNVRVFQIAVGGVRIRLIVTRFISGAY